jgi:hypothetical protein
MKTMPATPASILSAPSGQYVIAMVRDDGCAAGLDGAPPMALAAGALLLLGPGQSIRLIWGRTCGWTVWSVDASIVQRAARRAGLDRLVGLRAAAVLERGAVRDLVKALAREARRARPDESLDSGSAAALEDVMWMRGTPRRVDSRGEFRRVQ